MVASLYIYIVSSLILKVDEISELVYVSGELLDYMQMAYWNSHQASLPMSVILGLLCNFIIWFMSFICDDNALCNIINQVLEYFFWNCSQLDAKEHPYWQINIGSGNGLMLSGIMI